MTIDLTPLPALLRNALAEGKVFTPQGERVDLHSNISEVEALELYEAIRELRPELSIEVGFAQAVSAQAILQALEDNSAGHHHVMDPFQAKYEDCGLEMVRRAGLAHRMTFHRKFAEQVIPDLPEIGFAFIDASHLFDLTVCEFVLADKKLKIGGAVAFHDMWMPAQQAFIRYVLSNRNYRVFRAKKSPPQEDGPRQSLAKKLMRRVCAAIPKADRIFLPEFLRPWSAFELGNLVILQKTAHDERDWKFHRQF